MRFLLPLAVLWLASCSSPEPAPKAAADPATDASYAETVKQLAALNREAEDLWKAKKPDDAAARITRGQALQTRLLAPAKPTLAAMEAASDLDHLYGRMLLENRHYGFARMLFQKNQIRWKNWQPQTEETARRQQEAAASIAECDRRMSQ